MSKEQIYLSCDGREEAKKWIDVTENPNKAWNIAAVMGSILELNDEQLLSVKNFIDNLKTTNNE